MGSAGTGPFLSRVSPFSTQFHRAEPLKLLFQSVIMKHSLKIICMSLFSAVAPSGLSAAEISYRWNPGQKFSYQVEVVADSDTETTTYKGVIHYTVGAANDGQSTVTYRGGLHESKKSKAINRGPFGPRGFRPPSIPSPFSRPTFRGKVQTTNTITITPRGQTLAMDGDSQLPYLLGNVSLLPFEPLPAGDAQKWTDDGGVSITEKGDDDRHPFGRFGPMSPLGRDQSDSVQAAGEVSAYQLTGTDGDLLTFTKTYRLHTPPTKDNPSFDMTGEGIWTFDAKENVPHAYDMKFNLQVKVKNTITTVPITVKYNRLLAEKVAEMEAAAKKRAEDMAAAAAERKRIAETPLTPEETQQAVAALASNHADTVREMLGKLAGKSVKEPDQRIAQAIRPHLTSNDRRISKSAQDAMTKWSPEYAKQKKLDKSYQGPAPVSSTGLVVESITPLYVGQIVQARRRNRGSFWYPARIKQLLRDGTVELGFLTWGEERGRSSETVARNDIQLAPPELTQPARPASMPRTSKPRSTMPGTSSSAAPPARPATTKTAHGMRTWIDATGRFKIEADFVSLADGTVTLRRADGKNMEIPLEKLSAADQTHARKSHESEADNPFKLVE